MSLTLWVVSEPLIASQAVKYDILAMNKKTTEDWWFLVKVEISKNFATY